MRNACHDRRIESHCLLMRGQRFVKQPADTKRLNQTGETPRLAAAHAIR
jgi:hypothetical protein